MHTVRGFDIPDLPQTQVTWMSKWTQQVYGKLRILQYYHIVKTFLTKMLKQLLRFKVMTGLLYSKTYILSHEEQEEAIEC